MKRGIGLIDFPSHFEIIRRVDEDIHAYIFVHTRYMNTFDIILYNFIRIRDYIKAYPKAYHISIDNAPKINDKRNKQ